MKSRVYFCVLVVIACHIAITFGTPLVIGDCELDDLPEASHDKCRLIHCSKNELGVISVTEAECGLTNVPRCFRKKLTLVNDPDEIYPRCCYRPICY